MTQQGETDGFTAFDHLDMIVSHTKNDILNCCLVNSGRLKYGLLLNYAKEKSFPVLFDRERFEKIGITAFEGDVVSKDNYLRHDSAKIAKEVMNIYNYYSKKRWKELKNS